MNVKTDTSTGNELLTISELSAVPMASIYAGYTYNAGLPSMKYVRGEPVGGPAMRAEPIIESPTYLLCGLDRKIREKVLEEAWEAKRSGRLPVFDGIAVAGVSGLIVGSVLAAMWCCDLFVVRKPGESSHSVCTVEGPRKVGRYLIVDDFVASGATAERIRTQMATYRPHMECVGVYVYAGQEGRFHGLPIVAGRGDFLRQEMPF